MSKEYQWLDDREHVLLKPDMYIGSIKHETINTWIINDDNKAEAVEVSYNPGFLKIFDEIITNSVDESKTKGSKLDTIKVTIKNNNISVWDNGGIKVEKHKQHKVWIPEMIFSNLKAGSNLSKNQERTWAGTFGVGSSLTNIYSKIFKVSTCDGKNHFTQTFKDNLLNRNKPAIKASSKNHTEITYTPDYEKFDMTEIDNDHYLLLKKRVYDIAATNTNLKIFFNGKRVKIESFKDYISLYTDNFLYTYNKHWQIGITSSEDGFKQVSFVNSTETKEGGTHVDYIQNQITDYIVEYFRKKHKTTLKASNVRNHIFIFVNAMVYNPSFKSQTKEKLSTKEKDFGTEFKLTNKFLKEIIDSEITNLIKDWIVQKEEADKNREQRALNRSVEKIKVSKLIDSKGRNRKNHSFAIFEGDSAVSSFRKYRDSQTMGAMPIRGKFINALKVDNTTLANNIEAMGIMAAIGLKIGQNAKQTKLRYDKILLYTDADVDGNAIAASLINFFFKYWPELFEMGMVYRVETPIVVASPKNKKNKKIMFYSQKDYDDWAKKGKTSGYEIDYKKGLAALIDDEYNEIINNPRLLQIKMDKKSKESLEEWFGKDSEPRKKHLLN